MARQNNLELATGMAFKALGRQCDDQLLWLGARSVDDTWQLDVLDDTFVVDLPAERVSTLGDDDVGAPGAPGAPWRILALHYLAITSRPPKQPPETTFVHLPAGQPYARVYEGRVLGRLCATAGRDADTLRVAADSAGGRSVDPLVGDLAFDFDFFAQISVRLIWHAPDDEFGPSATLLLPSNIESYLCPEDIVVLSECLVSRLGETVA